MSYRLTFLFFLLLFFHEGMFAQQEDSKSALLLANKYVASGEVIKALTTLENILVIEPNNLQAQEKKLSILLENERSKDAYRDIDEYIRMYYDQPEYYYLRALLHMQKEKYSKAIDDFDRAIELDMPENSAYKVYLNRGMAYFYLRYFELAEVDFDDALLLNSKSATSYHGKGMVKYELGEYDEAVFLFQKALKIENDNRIVHYNLAMAFFRLKEMDNACYHFNRSCTLGHRNACRLLLMECAAELNIPK